MSIVPAIVTSAATLWLIAGPPSARAQTPFLDAIQELAATVDDSRTTPDVVTRRRLAARTRLTTAVREWDRALDTLQSRVARDLRDASDERAFQLHVELGLAFRQRGRLDDAARELDAAIAVRPDSSDVHLLHALTLDAAGRTAAAAAAVRTAWLRDTSNPSKAYLALASSQALEPSEHERAMHVLRDAVMQAMGPAPTRRAPFVVLDAVPDTLSRTPLVGDPEMAGVFTRLAHGQIDDALVALNLTGSLDTTGSSAVADFNRGREFESGGRYADARQAYAAALAGTLAGRHVLYIGIGRLAQVDGELDAAIEAFRHAVRLSPNNPVIRRELAGAYTAAGHRDDAFAELAAALLIDPLDAAALTAVGQLLLDTDRIADAVTVLTKAVAVSARGRDAHYALAMALTRAGRTDDAARTFDAFERLSREALEDRRRDVSGQAGPTGAARE